MLHCGLVTADPLLVASVQVAVQELQAEPGLRGCDLLVACKKQTSRFPAIATLILLKKNSSIPYH